MPAGSIPKDRLLRWQRKLLDLSLRNNLLNFQGGRRALKLEAPDPAALEDLLASGQPWALRPCPDLMDGADPRDQAIYEARERENVRRAHALEALRKREVFVGIPEAELDSRLTETVPAAPARLCRKAVPIRCISPWASYPGHAKTATASATALPLILVPVSLQRKSARSGFTLSACVTTSPASIRP